MRILVVTPKILDDSLSATTRLNIYDAVARAEELDVIGRLRKPRAWSRPTAWKLLPLTAPPIPGISMAWFHLAATYSVYRRMSRQAYDAILVEPDSLPTVLLARRLCRPSARRIGIVMDVRTMPIETTGLKAVLSNRITTFFVRHLTRRCAGVTAITPGVAAWVASVGNISASDIAIWSTGVNARVFDPSAYTRRSDGSEPVRFLYHGVLYLTRGLGELVSAADRLARSMTERFTVTLLGSGPDVQELAAQIDNLGLRDIVHLVDPVPQDEVAERIAQHDIGIVPLPDLECWASSSPTKLLEYMAMERPVVVTDIVAHRAIVHDDPYAVWAGGGHAEELAGAMRTALENHSTLKRAATQARERVLAEYTWEQQAKVLIAKLLSASRLESRKHA